MTRAMVTFIGAGPGDPDLITIKGQKVLAQADVVLYAGSLVSAEVLKFANPRAEIHNTAGMKLDQQVKVMTDAVKAGHQVARLHTGDPSIYGAIAEQSAALTAAGVPWWIIPGVSSAFAAAAALGIEYTLPEQTQSIILTRMPGRTPVPEAENLRSLAAHHTSLVIFLSTGLIREVTAELLSAGYFPTTPVALVYRASWPDEKIIRAPLAEIADLAEADEMTHQGLIIISPSLAEKGSLSHLYGGYQENQKVRTGAAIIAITSRAAKLGAKIQAEMPDAVLYIPERLAGQIDCNCDHLRRYNESIRQVLQSAFMEHEALICIMASGIVVRELAPLLKNKHSDPAVVVLDGNGKFAISLLSGHEGGANLLAAQIAAICGGQAVITTASDGQQLPAIDIIAQSRGWKLHPGSQLPAVIADLVNGVQVGVLFDPGCQRPSDLQAENLCFCQNIQQLTEMKIGSLIRVTYRRDTVDVCDNGRRAVVYYDPVLVVGVGCNRNTPAAEIREAIESTLSTYGLASESVACLATITAKGDEAGLVQAANESGLRLELVSADEIRQIEGLPNPSEYAQKALGVPGVAEPAACWVARNRRLLVEKQKFPNVTVAVALKGDSE